MRKIGGRVGGFTLVELMIVIAIIAILASIAIPQYLKYQRKAKVSSYALPIARACAMDMASACVENPTAYTINKTTTPNCYDANSTDQIFSTAGGDVTLTTNEGTCSNAGELSGASVTAELEGVNDYEVSCTIGTDIKCVVQGKSSP